MTSPKHSQSSSSFESSYYYASQNTQLNYDALTGDIQTDVCVVGGGVTGLSAAYHLQRSGFKTVVLEGNKIASGASGRNGGQMIVGFGCDHSKLRALAGKDAAQTLWDLSVEAVRYTKELVAKHNIDCDLRDGHLHVGLKKRHIGELKEMVRGLRRDFGYDRLRYLDKREINGLLETEAYNSGVYSDESGHLHPLNFSGGLAKAAAEMGATLYEHSPVTQILSKSKPTVITDNGRVRCQYIILAGNAYLSGNFPKVRSTVMPVGTYMIATESLGKARAKQLIKNGAAVADIQFVLDYYRLSADHRMLYGGKVSYSTLEPLSIKHAIRSRMRQIFPQLSDVRIDYAWGGLVGITLNRFPHFGRLRNDVYFAQGFSGHGVALTVLAGKLMADAVSKTASEFDVFAGVRHMPFPGGKWFRTPALVAGTLFYRLRDLM